MPDPESKTCNRCGEVKPLGDFNKRQAKCRPCESVTAREWRAKNIEKKKQADRDWYVKNRDTNLAYQAEWREANRERKRAYDRAYRQANLERRREQDRIYRETHREEIRDYFRKLNAENPERGTESWRKRKIRIKQLESEPYTRREIYDRDGGCCRLCGTPLPYERGAFHIDHIVPVSLQGPDIPANVQLACVPCNMEKRDRLEGQIHMAL